MPSLGSSTVAWMAAVLALLATGDAGAQPKFDCAKGFKPIERLICGDPEIWPIENATFAAWRHLRRTLDDNAQKALLANQRVWIRRYPERCGLPAHGKLTAAMGLAARECVMQSLHARTAELEALASVNFVSRSAEDPDRVRELERILADLDRAEQTHPSMSDPELLSAYSGEAPAAGGPAVPDAEPLTTVPSCSCAETYCAEFAPAPTTLRGTLLPRPGAPKGQHLALLLDDPVCVLPDAQNEARGPQIQIPIVGEPDLLPERAGPYVTVRGELYGTDSLGLALRVETLTESAAH